MKKFSIVLLALLLAGGFAFAAELALNGEVESSFGLDFDKEEYGFAYDASVGFDLTWTGEATSSGEGDVYAVITVEDVELNFDETGSAAAPFETIDGGDVSATIYGPDWEVALGSSTGFGNASSPDMDMDDDTDSADFVEPSFENGNGLAVTYSGLTVGFDFFYDNDANDDDTMGDDDLMYMVTTGYSADLADGLTAEGKVAVASLSGSTSTDFFGTLALAYAMDAVAVDAAFDMVYDGSFTFDASASATYTMDDMAVMVAGYYESPNGGIDALLSVDYTGVEDATIGLWAYLNDGFNDDLTPSAPNSDEELYALAVGADLEYALDDVYTPYASVAYEYSEAASMGYLPVEVGVKAALIDNAAVKLKYATDDALDFANNKGKVTASVTVEL